MHKILTITLAIFLTACVSTPKSTLSIKNNYLKQPNEVLLTLVGVKEVESNKSDVSGKSYLLQVERLELVKEKRALQSFHVVRANIEDNEDYQLMTKEENSYIYVWLENVDAHSVVSNVSAVSDFGIPEITLNESMQTIAISSKGISRDNKLSRNPCRLRYSLNNVNHGFEGSVADKKLPARYNGPRC